MNIGNINMILKTKRDFLKNLVDAFVLRPSEENENDDDDSVYVSEEKPKITSGSKPRADSLVELKSRLLTGKKTTTRKEKLAKKALKRKLRQEKIKQLKLNNKNPKSSLPKPKSEIQNSCKESTDPSSDSVGVLYSKINFPIEEVKQVKKDPQQLLAKLKKDKEVISKVQQSGDLKKAVEVRHKKAFDNALNKACGVKVKDDVQLLQKSIKRKEQKKKQSKKKWDARIKQVESLKEKRQEKRKVNIDKRKKDKKNRKIKKAVKKGKVVPGF